MSKFKPGRSPSSSSAVATAPRQKIGGNARFGTAILNPALEATGTSGPHVQPEQPTDVNPARLFALNCTLIFIFFRFSFAHEFISYFLHFDMHLLVILGSLCYFAWFMAGNMFAAFSEKQAWIWLWFVFFMAVATLTSVWRGGSMGVLVPYIRTTLPLLLLIPTVIGAPADVRRVVNTIGLAGTATALFGLVHRSYNDGRFDVGGSGSSIQDPNDYAAHMIFLLPAMAYFLFKKERSALVKVFGVGVMLAALMEIMSTGSRGGLVGLIVTAAYLIVTGTPKIRIFLLLGVPVMAALALPFVPQQSVRRLQSVFDSSVETESAAASADARRELLKASLAATFSHPISGVGPGVFIIYQADMASAVGQKGMWHETHNGYTQISSECGLPALLLYLSAVFMAFKSFRKASKYPDPDIAIPSRTLAIMIVSFSSTLVFLAQGYRPSMLAVGAISIAVTRIIKERTGSADWRPISS